MPQPAQVTSVEALEAFKSSLIVYLEKGGRLLDEVSEDVVRTRIWLETDRQLYWKKLVHQRTKEMAQAEQELLTARLSDMPEAIKARRLAVNKAKLALHRAEDGLARVKQWLRRYETEVESRTKVVVQLRQLLGYDMSKAVAFLEGAVSTLAAYAEMSAPSPLDPRTQTGDPDVAARRNQTAEPPAPEGGFP